jgi:hypothetical protein
MKKVGAIISLFPKDYFIPYRFVEMFNSYSDIEKWHEDSYERSPLVLCHMEQPGLSVVLENRKLPRSHFTRKQASWELSDMDVLHIYLFSQRKACWIYDEEDFETISF